MAQHSNNKVSLMASLTGGDLPEPEQDLFGEIPLEDELPDPKPQVLQSLPPNIPPSPSDGYGQLIIENPLDDGEQNNDPTITSNIAGVAPNLIVSQLPPNHMHQLQQQQNYQERQTNSKAKSLLASSGLLSDLSGVGSASGGLFDLVDREEEERLRREQEKQFEEAQLRRQEEERQQQEASNRRIHAEQQMMQSVSLSATTMVSSGYPHQMAGQRPPMNEQMHSSAAHSPQQLDHVTNQMNRMGMSTPMPMSFAERSQIMQQQHASSQYHPTPAAMHPHQSEQSRTDAFSPAGFYRPDPLPVSPQSMLAQPNTYVVSSTGGAVQTHTISPLTRSVASATTSSRLPPPTTPSYTVGMHNAIGRYQARPPPVVRPTPFEPLYGEVTVNDPILCQPPSLFNVVPPHWIYQIQTALKEGGFWVVRRRFRHIVALEERLREECPGAILPPRPNKHSTRAIEEASTVQSSEFAMQRCAEIQTFLNSTVHHPFAGRSSSLKLFLSLQDNMGTAWPEVSNNALTRLGAVSGAAVQNVSEAKMPWDSQAYHSKDALEDNAELLALANSEGIRMGAVTQAVPKLEGAITLLREYGEAAGSVGMELNKLGKDVEASDRDLGLPMDLLAQGLLRHSRRQKRLSLELSVAMSSFVTQYRMCKYEKLAFGDRRNALQRRVKERGRADLRAQRLMAHQQGYQINGGLGELDRLERDASMSDGLAVGAYHQCDVIGETLKSEVNRVAYERRTEWSKSMKVVCSAMKEAAGEQRSIWEATRDSFLQSFPEYSLSS